MTQVTYRFFKQILSAGAFPLLAVLLLPVLAHAGLSPLFSTLIDTTYIEQPTISYNAQTVPLLKAAIHPDPNPSKGGGDIIVDEDGALVSNASPSGNSTEINDSNGEISVYIVREADSLSQIAEMFGVSANTILWANDIKSPDLIRPNDTLVILPISGVSHIVKSGDTLKAIAKKYGGDVDDIILYNRLTDANDITPGDTVVIPGGEVASPPAPKTSSGSYAVSVPTYTSTASGYFAHPLPGSRKTQGIHGYNGVDLAASPSTPIRAAAAGDVILVRSAGWNGGYGKYIVVRHANGTQTLYAHNSSNIVSIGQRVVQGQVVGYVGSSGRSTGSHLHFEVRGARNPF